MRESIATAVAVQFGPHFAKNIAPLKSFFSADPGWTIDATRWGLLQTAVTVPCAIFPWVVGHRVDKRSGPKEVLVCSLIFTCIGQLIFSIACKDTLFPGAVMGRAIFGIGEGLTSSLTGYIAVRFAPAHKMFAIALTQSLHALSIATSKALLAPVAEGFHTYIASLVLALLVCLVSLGFGVAWKPRPTPLSATDVCVSPRSQRVKLCCQGRPGQLSIDFWMVAIIHFLFSSAHRLFGHIDAPFLASKFGHSLSAAGYSSSVTEFVAVFVAPILGALLDKYCTIHTLPLLTLFAAILGTVGYGILGFTPDTATFGVYGALFMIGVVNGITPTVLKSVLSETIHETVLATGFGVYESAESVGVSIGAVLIGVSAARAHDDYSSSIPVFSALLLTAGVLAYILNVRRRRAFQSSFHTRDASNYSHADTYGLKDSHI